MQTGLSHLSTEQFAIGPCPEADDLALELVGYADVEAEGILGGYLRLVDAEACRSAVGSVTVDLTQLLFMSSSCFKAFILWIDRVNQMQVWSRYQIRLVSNPQHHWQRRSLDALRRMAPDTVRVVGGKEPLK